MENIKRSYKTYLIVGITAFLLGAVAETVFLMAVLQKSMDHINWAYNHPKEVQWTIDRYNLFQQASNALFFQNEKDTGVTIIKPEGMLPKP
jgi:hypothetical protein